MDTPYRPGRRWDRLVASVAAGLLVAACTAPTESPSATPVPVSSSVAPSPSPSPPVPGAASPSVDPNPAAMPAPPGAVETGRVVELDDGWREVTVSYRAAVPLDTVRVHYRRALRTGGWRITDVDVDSASAGWELEAVRGAREVEIQLIADGAVTLVSVTESAPAS